MAQFIVKRDGDYDLKFTGELLGESSSWSEHNDSRWTRLEVYVLTSGKFICSEIGETRWQGEQTKYKGLLCPLQT